MEKKWKFELREMDDFDKIPDYITKREKIPLSNPFQILSLPDGHDFHLVLYYISNDKFEVVARRLDEIGGWNFDLKIKMENKIYSIGSSIENCKKICIYSDLILKKIIDNENQKIPKIICQTSKDNKIINKYHMNSVMTLLEWNPEYEYYFFDNCATRKFIQKHFDKKYVETYDKLVPGAYRADFFRYCFLYIHGGCYFDNKQILRIPLRDFIEDEEEIYAKDRFDDYIFNAVLMSVPRKKIYLKLLDSIVQNVQNNFYGLNSLYPTGPKLFHSYNGNKNIKLYHTVDGKYYLGSQVVDRNGKLFSNTHFKNYYHDNDLRTDKNAYLALWNNKEIYFLKKCNSGNYIIFIYPSIYTDTFSIQIHDEILIIQRTDEESGWGQNLKVKIVNDITSEEYIVSIGSSDKNKKEMSFLH